MSDPSRPSTDRPLNILLVNDHLGWDGEVLHGVARLFLTWVPALEGIGHEVKVCVLREEDSLSEYFYEKNIDICFLDRHKFDPRTVLDLTSVVSSHGTDVIHAQGYAGVNFGRLAGLITGVPVLVHQHDTSDYYPWYQWCADGVLNWSADRYLAVSEGVVEHCREHRNMFGVGEDKIEVCYNCVDISEFKEPSPQDVRRVRERFGLPDSSTIVGTVTRLFAPKGNRYLIEAVPKIIQKEPEVRVVIVGDGPERERLEERAETIGVDDKVIFTGFRDDVATILGLFDVFVIASWGTEGLPLTAIEAMAMEKPIVTTDIVEIISDEESGLVVPARDSASLADAVLRLLNHPDLAERLAAGARERSEALDVSKYVQRLSGIYAELADER